METTELAIEKAKLVLDQVPVPMVARLSGGTHVKYVNKRAAQRLALAEHLLEVSADLPFESSGDEEDRMLDYIVPDYIEPLRPIIRIRTVPLVDDSSQAVLGDVFVWREVTRAAAAREDVAITTSLMANVSHELRTPLTGIVGAVDLLVDIMKATPEKNKLIEIIRLCSNHLSSVIDNALDYSKIQASKMELESVGINIAEDVVTHALLITETSARSKGVHVTISGQCTELVNGDPVRLRQVLVNLLANAIKFTPEGGTVLLRTDLVVDTTDCDAFTLMCTVQDTGCGMTEETLHRIFTPYTQANASTTRETGGTGLGLSICKHLVQLMRGDIRVSSTRGVGSTFTFQVPLRRATKMLPISAAASADRELRECLLKPLEAAVNETSLPPPPTPKSAAKWILVAEDNLVNQLILKNMLTRLGYKNLTIVDDGLKAVEAVLKAGETHPALVFMDLHMPEMDGLEATKRILAINPAIPIVALSASVLPEDVEQSRSAGMVAHISKPYNRAKIGYLLQHMAVRISSPPMIQRREEYDQTAWSGADSRC